MQDKQNIPFSQNERKILRLCTAEYLETVQVVWNGRVWPVKLDSDDATENAS